MTNTNRHIILWIAFVILTTVGFWIIENLEGIKFRTIPDLFIIVYGGLYALVIYFVTFFIFSILVQRFLNNAVAKIIVYIIASSALGIFTFQFLYPTVLIDRYGLQITTSILVFGAIGIVYALIDFYIYKKLNPAHVVKRKYKVIGLILCCCSLVIVGFNLYSKYTYVYEGSEHEVLHKTAKSPNKEYVAKAYGIPYGGAAGGVKVRVDIESSSGDYIKSIYFSELLTFNMTWMGNEILNIKNNPSGPIYQNRSIKLNVSTEIYDEDGSACESLVMKDDYETCYQF